MSDAIAAARVEPLVAEMRLMRETMVTKADLERIATKKDLEVGLSAFETRFVKWWSLMLMMQLAVLILLVDLLT